MMSAEDYLALQESIKNQAQEMKEKQQLYCAEEYENIINSLPHNRAIRYIAYCKYDTPELDFNNVTLEHLKNHTDELKKITAEDFITMEKLVTDLKKEFNI